MTDLRNYTLVTSAYWGFTLTDGALRMLVLLHFYALGYSAVQIAFLFLSTNFSVWSPTWSVAGSAHTWA